MRFSENIFSIWETLIQDLGHRGKQIPPSLEQDPVQLPRMKVESPVIISYVHLLQKSSPQKSRGGCSPRIWWCSLRDTANKPSLFLTIFTSTVAFQQPLHSSMGKRFSPLISVGIWIVMPQLSGSSSRSLFFRFAWCPTWGLDTCYRWKRKHGNFPA